MSTQRISFVNGSTALKRVWRVASSRLRPSGMAAENAKGPAGMGQEVLVSWSGDGNGDGGRKVVQK